MLTRTAYFIKITALLLFLTASVFASQKTNSQWFGTSVSLDENPVRVEVLNSDVAETVLNFSFRGAELIAIDGRDGFETRIVGEGHTSIDGVPSLPKISRLVAIPPKAKVLLDYTYSDLLVMEDIKLLPTFEQSAADLSPDEELYYDETIYKSDSYFPSELVEMGDPAIMRDFRIVRVTVNPLRYNPVKNRLELYRNVSVVLRYTDGGIINIKQKAPAKISKSFANLYADKIANYDLLDFEVDEEWGTLLIIAPNNGTVLSQLQPLVDWKVRKGIETVLVTTTTCGGNNSTAIKNYIQEAYNTWEPKLSYVLLIGDTDGSIAVAASNSTGDHAYTQLEGGDILSDVAIGRFSCATNDQLMTEINKIIFYESTPYMGETEWYKKGAVYAGSGSGISTIYTKKTIRVKALIDGYAAVDTSWYNQGGQSVSVFTNNSINGGVGFYNYRGYYGMSGYSTSNINQLINYYKLPFVVTITCGTGDIVGSGSDYTEEFFRVGSPGQPKGAIGAIGTATTSTHTRFNNCVDYGIFGAFYDYDIFQMGDALVSAKWELYISYPDNPSNVANFSYWNNLIGDPTCQLWTAIPQAMEVNYEQYLPLGSTSIAVSVLDSVSQTPLPEVEVCLSGSGLSLYALSDSLGNVIFELPELLEGEYNVTCCRHNYIPHLGRFEVDVEDVFVNYETVVIDDDNSGASIGNNDGNINPGETIELSLSLKNYGNTLAATNIMGTLSIDDPLVTISDPLQNFPNIAPGNSCPVYESFIFSVEPDASHQAILQFNLEVEASQGTWDSYLPLEIFAPSIVYQNHQVEDPNGRLDPGDLSTVVVTVMNIGGLTGDNLVAYLDCSHNYININQNIANIGSMAPNSSTDATFEVSVAPLVVPGTVAHFELQITGDNNFECSSEFESVVGMQATTDPTGPDDYGYYALDNTDEEYSGFPTYEWIEIDPTFGGSGYMISLNDYGNEQDDTRLLGLPFSFQYYGVNFDTIAVCSNGWMAFGAINGYLTQFRNWYIPSSLGPYSLVAPFWDDLYLMNSPPGKVYYYYDEAEHKFIVEWSRVKNRAPGNPLETFEVILYDPQYYPTDTGDGEIVFQYYEVTDLQGISTDNHYATVGIKSNDNLDGLQYVYWNHYSPGAAELQAERAIRFTTNVPINQSAPSIVHQPHPNVTEQLDYYAIQAHIASWTSLEEETMRVYWRTSSSGPFTIQQMLPVSSGIPEEYVAFIPEQPPSTAIYYYIYAEDDHGMSSILPENAPDDLYMFIVGPPIEIVFDDVEEESGWTLGIPGDDATSGVWIRDDPVESLNDYGLIAQPEDDYTIDPGHISFVTGNADLGAPGGTNDVDGGKTTLVSPVYNLENVNFPTFSYYYWYTNDLGYNPGEDNWVVEVSNNGGSNWESLVITTASTPQMWQFEQILLHDYIAITDQVQVRFIASDYSGGSLVEACIDDIRIIGIDTTWGDSNNITYIHSSGIDMDINSDLITINWEPVPDASAYRIYSADNPESTEYEFIGQTQETNYKVDIGDNTCLKQFYVIRVIK